MSKKTLVAAIAPIIFAVVVGAVLIATHYPPAVATVVAALKATANDTSGFEVVEYAEKHVAARRWSNTVNLRGTEVRIKWREGGPLGKIIHEQTFFVIHPDDVHHTDDVPNNFKSLARGILGGRERGEEWFHDLDFN